MRARPATSLIDAAVARLTALGWLGTVHEVVVGHPHRAVLRASDAQGRSIFVKAEVGSARSRREVHALALVEAADIPVPHLRHAELGERSLLVLDAVPGAPLAGGEDPSVWEAAARLVARVHSLPVREGLEFDHREAGWLEFMRWWIRHEAALVVQRRMLDEITAGRLHEQVDAVLCAMPEPARRMLHGDCQPAHVLVTGRTVSGLVDWGDASSGDPLWDVAVLTAHHPDRLAVVLGATGAGPGADEVVRAYWVLRHLGSATWMADHGFDPTRDLRAAAALAVDG